MRRARTSVCAVENTLTWANSVTTVRSAPCPESVFGQGQLATTTKAFDEAGTRVSRQLLKQSLVSLLYGIAVFVGLYFLHSRTH
jgi:hypothetical protein